MQRGHIRGLFATGALLVFAAFCFTFPAFVRAEGIDSFDGHLAIQKNGTVLVTERITYDFGADQKHGIYRTIPLASPNGPAIAVSDVNVADPQGDPYPFTVSDANGEARIQIGDPNATVTGQKTYVIDYVVGNAIRGFTDHEELYWNVTGNDWAVPIASAKAEVALPDPVATDVNVKCFTGPAGSAGGDCTASQNGGNALFAATRSLGAGEGLTVVVGMPLGSVTSLATGTAGTSAASGSGSAEAPLPVRALFNVFPVFIALIIFARVARVFSPNRPRGRAPRPVIPKELKHDPLVAEYEPPDKLPPIEVGTILDRQVDPTDISSVIIDLAVRGYLKIRYLKRAVLFFAVKDFELVRTKDGADLATPADQGVFAMLFSGRDVVSVSALGREAFAVRRSVKKIQDDTIARIEDEGYFDKEGRERAKKAMNGKMVAFAAGFALFYISLTFLPAASPAVSSAVAFFLFALLIALAVILGRLAGRAGYALTPKGIDAMRKILGFMEFLKVTETDRLKMLDAPAMEPAFFERCLPYAMVLGVEKEWAKRFEGIYTAVPDWYEDASMRGFSAPLFVSQLALFNTAMNGSFGAYGGSGPYSSGFSGGFSGGGSGGGGGGSW